MNLFDQAMTHFEHGNLEDQIAATQRMNHIVQDSKNFPFIIKKFKQLINMMPNKDVALNSLLGSMVEVGMTIQVILDTGKPPKHLGGRFDYPSSLSTDPALHLWAVNASKRAGGFLQRVCAAAQIADTQNYALLRPALVELMVKYPHYLDGERIEVPLESK